MAQLAELLDNRTRTLLTYRGRKRGRVSGKRAIAEFVASDNSHVLESKVKTGRQGPANSRWHKKRDPENFRSHSHKIEELAKSSARVQIMSNKRKPTPGYHQSPCHRDMLPDEQPNVGPAPQRQKRKKR